MSEDILIPKMTRVSRQKRKLRIPLINFVVVIFGTLLLVGASFLNIDIKHYIIPAEIFSNKNIALDDFIFSFYLIPQIPAVMFICAALGKKMSITSITLYILAGLAFLPVFALGGGIRYIFEYGFGYILAYIPAAAIAGNLLGKRYSFLDMIKAVLAGVLFIHAAGIIYMCLIALIKHSGSGFITGWISAQSGLKIIYDIIASFVLMLPGKYIHKFLTFILE